jgi:hypothetical protein
MKTYKVPKAPSEILLNFLLSQNLVSSDSKKDWFCTAGGLTDNPDNAIAIYDTTPFIDGYILETGEPIKHYGISVTVRSLKYPDGWQKGEELESFMCASSKTPMFTGEEYQLTLDSFVISSGIHFFGNETKNNRKLFQFSGRLTIQIGVSL